MKKITSVNTLMIATGLMASLSGTAMAADEVNQEQVFNPDIERADVVVPAIDSESFELGAYFGSMRVLTASDNSLVYGLRGTYHINDLLFIEGSAAGLDLSVNQKSGAQEMESASVGSYYYNASMGFNLIPGELFVTKNTVMPIFFYGIAGVGNMVIDDTSTFTLNLGVGMKVLMTDSFALRFDIQDHISDIGLSDDTETVSEFKTNKMELSMGVSYFF